MTAALTAPPSSNNAMLGRFQLRRSLGKGAQAVVWLAFDPRLEREVAVKLMHVGASANAVNQWLQEARSVSRLKHPSIVPLFEADVHEQQPYLVFEYVPGPTLSEVLRTRGALPAREAVELMVSVLDALQAAHEAGVVHRDLKPSNILIDENGRARVMDFGIAARVQDPGNAQKVVGTPGYMSPEATQGVKPAPAMDLFSVGLVLGELLSGKPLIAERDPIRAMYRVAHEDLTLPSGLVADADDKLRALVQRTLSRDPTARHASAAELRDALLKWLAPSADAAELGTHSKGTLEFLLRRMRHRSDFPALSDSMARIQRLASSESESLASLSSEILKDVALTNKLLRMVNTAYYTQSGGSISTVSRAVAMVGFAGIRNLALSLVLLEHMHDKAHANVLKEEFLRSLMAGSVASELCPGGRDAEEAFLGAMFQNLGRLLTEFYFPEEARQVQRLVRAASPRAGGLSRTPVSEESAAVSVLGLSFEELGLGVAKAWGLPETLQRCIQKPKVEPPARRSDKADLLRWLAMAGNEVTDAMLQAAPGQLSANVAKVAERYGKVLEVSARDVQAAAAVAQQRLVEMARAMGLQAQPGSPMRRLLTPSGNGTGSDANEPDCLSEHQLQATPPASAEVPMVAIASAATPAALAAAAQNHGVAAMLAAGIQDITNTMVEDFKLNEVLRMILETMLRALEFRRILFCLRDPKTEALTGRFGLGDDVDSVLPYFKVRLKPTAADPPDLFTAVCMKGADTLIADTSASSISGRLPAWYGQNINAPSFLLLPLLMKGSPFALIYADRAHVGGIELGEKELSMLRTLRNQAVMAFKQSSS